MSMTVLSLITAAIVGASALLPTTTQPGMGDDDHPARAFLVSEHGSLTPGSTVRIGVMFEIDHEWHLYWDGQNDSGFAPEINLTLPEGFSAGEVQWPAPKRYISPGDILDHIYEHQVLLLIPVKVPAEATPADAVSISAEVDWLVCREACIPGSATVVLTLPIAEPGEEPRPGRHTELFMRTTERLPRPLPKSNPPVTFRRSGEVVTITAKGAKKLAFYPANDCAPLVNPLKDAQAERDSLSLRLSRPEQSTRIAGVLEVWTGPGASQVWAFETEPKVVEPAAAAPLPAADQ